MTTAKEKLVREIQLRLGSGMIDLEADPEHYDLAIQMALDRYRQRATNAMEESFIFLDIQPHQEVYTLPSEVQLVRQVYRRGIGGNSGTGAQIDPFNLAYTNNLYMLSNPSQSQQAGSAGSLATYDLAMGYQEMAGRMFGRDVIFTWDHTRHRLTLHRKFGAVETILLWAYNQRPDDLIISDTWAKPWIRDYSVAAAKMIIGEARSKFSQIAGPQGGTTLNGEAMKTEGIAEMERLEIEVMNQIDGGGGYGFTIG